MTDSRGFVDQNNFWVDMADNVKTVNAARSLGSGLTFINYL